MVLFFFEMIRNQAKVHLSSTILERRIQTRGRWTSSTGRNGVGTGMSAGSLLDEFFWSFWPEAARRLWSIGAAPEEAA
jgi:hypothetical protein